MKFVCVLWDTDHYLASQSHSCASVTSVWCSGQCVTLTEKWYQIASPENPSKPFRWRGFMTSHAIYVCHAWTPSEQSIVESGVIKSVASPWVLWDAPISICWHKSSAFRWSPRYTMFVRFGGPYRFRTLTNVVKYSTATRSQRAVWTKSGERRSMEYPWLGSGSWSPSVTGKEMDVTGTSHRFQCLLDTRGRGCCGPQTEHHSAQLVLGVGLEMDRNRTRPVPRLSRSTLHGRQQLYITHNVTGTRGGSLNKAMCK